MSSFDLEHQWEKPRLFSVHGIGEGAEAENRVTSALLSVMKIVPDFTSFLLDSLELQGLPKIRSSFFETYYQPHMKTTNGQQLIPDGALIVRGNGGKKWSAFIEVKTGKDRLSLEQLNTYVGLAAEKHFDALITISDYISNSKNRHPLYDEIKHRDGVQVVHLSWAYIATRARVYQDYMNQEDPEQRWIIGEFIRYLEDKTSKVANFYDMGSSWNPFLNKVQNRTLTESSHELDDITSKLLELTSYALMNLEARTGLEIHKSKSRRDVLSFNDEKQLKRREILSEGTFTSLFYSKEFFSPLKIEVDFSRKAIICSVELKADDDRTNEKKASWFLKQVKEINVPQLRIKVKTKYKGSANEIVIDASDLFESKQLVPSGRDISAFKVSINFNMGLLARSNSDKTLSFINSYISAVYESYDMLLHGFKPYRVLPPALNRNQSLGDKEESKPNEAPVWLSNPNDFVIAPPPILGINKTVEV